RQRVKHAVMAHRDAVIDRDRVEFLGDAAGRLDLARNELPHVLQMHVPRHELREGVHHRDDRLAESAVLHAGGAPEAARAGHVAAVGGGTGTIGWHGVSSGVSLDGAALSVRLASGSSAISWHGQQRTVPYVTVRHQIKPFGMVYVSLDRLAGVR